MGGYVRGRLFPRAVGVRRCRWVKAKKSARVSPTLLVLIFGGLGIPIRICFFLLYKPKTGIYNKMTYIRCRFLLADKPQADGLGNII